MDDLVGIATFTFPNESDVLQTLLENEGVTFFMQNEGASIVMPPLATGGITLVVKSADVERAVDLMKRDGFGQYLYNDFL